MAVVNVPPDGRIYSLGPITGTIYVYDPGPAQATYDLTIVGVGSWTDVTLQPGYTNNYPGDGSAVYVRNHVGGNRIQVLHLPAEELTPETAGWSVVDEVPAEAGAPA